MDVLAPYRVRPVEVPETLRRSDVGAAAWWRLLDDGVVRPLWGDVALAADLAETPERRSVAIAELVPARGVVGRGSAVWLHTGRFPPRRVDVLVATRTRRADPHPLRTTAESTFSDEDVVQVGSVRATTVQRTGLDLRGTSRSARRCGCWIPCLPPGSTRHWLSRSSTDSQAIAASWARGRSFSG